MQDEIYHVPDSVILGLPNTMTVSLQVLSFTNEYQWTQRLKRSRPLDKRWVVTMGAELLEEDHWIALDAVTDEIEGTAGIFSAWIPTREVPLGIANGIGGSRPALTQFSDDTTFSDGTRFISHDVRGYVNSPAPRGARSVMIQNLTASTAGVLQRGDFFSILHGARRIPMLYRCLRPAVSDAAGIAAVDIAPALRFPVAVGDVINFWRPRTVWQFVEQPAVNLTAPMLGAVTFTMSEVPEVLYEGDV